MKVPEPRKLPSGNYFIQLRLGGESISITAPTAKECKDKAALVKAQHKVNQPKQKRVTKPLTLGKAIDKYINEKSNTLSPSTIRGYDTIRRTRFKNIMDKSMTNVSWQKAVNDEALLCSPKTLKNAWGLVNSVLKSNGIVVEVTLPQVPVADKKYLTPEEIKVFIKAVKDKPCAIPALLALHSMRRSEILALDWSHIDLKKKDIYVKGAMVYDKEHNLVDKPTNKNRSSTRHIPIMIPELYDLLSAVEDKQGKVVTRMPNKLWYDINKVCRDNRLPEVGCHGLRHSFASLAYHLGMPEMVAMEIGGWSDYTTMRNIYTHIAATDIKRHANVMADFYNSFH